MGPNETPGKVLNPQPRPRVAAIGLGDQLPQRRGLQRVGPGSGHPFHSLCQHHMLPFKGVAQGGYLAGKRILGLWKLAQVVEHLSHRLQVQERLTKQVADWLDDQLDPKGVGVVLGAEHLCMILRGTGEG